MTIIASLSTLTKFLNQFSCLFAALCNLDCGDHGHCELGKCRCDAGWTGLRCEQLPCDARCQEHGQCKNGTCVCSQGWNGRHCTLRECFFQKNIVY